MELLELPAELLDDIVNITFRHGGFKSFALASKASYTACESYIPRHHALTRKWSIVSLAESDAKTALEVILGILRDPDVAYFIEKLDLRCGLVEHHIDFEHSDAELLTDMLVQSPYLISAGQSAEHWTTVICPNPLGSGEVHHIEFGPRDVIYQGTFLLTLLPNLVELTLPEDWPGISNEALCCIDVLCTVVNDLQQPCDHKTRDDLPLGKLRYLHFHEEAEYDPMPRSGLGAFAPFLGIPSLAHFNGTNVIAVDDGYTGIPFSWPFSNTDSNVQEVSLHAGCIDAGGIGEFLKHTPHLTSLTYHHHTKWHGCQHDWDAGAFVNAAAMHRGDTLTQLTVTLACLFGDVETGIVSLKDFTRLEYITLDVQLFCAPAPDSGATLGDAGTGPKGWTLEDIPHLSAILPRSIRSLQLVSRGGEGSKDITALRQLLKGSKQLIATKEFSRLERITVHFHDLRILESRDVGQDAGKKWTNAGNVETTSLRSVLEAVGARWTQLESD